MSFLGLNFGISKGKSSSTTNLDKTENIFQQSSQNTQGTNNTVNTATGTQNSTGSSTSSQTGVTDTDVNKTSTGATSTNLFGTNVLSGLEDTVLGLLGGTRPGMTPADLADLSSFNKDTYIKGTMDAATARENTGLDATRGAVGDMVGSKIGNSSMATLLLDRATNDSAASLAGIRGQAEGNAAGIATAIANAKTAAAGETDSMLANLLQALKGGTQVSTQTGTEGTKGTTTNSATGTTNTNEASTTNQMSTSLQTISQLVSALLEGTNTTKATETSKGTTSGMTAGVSAQLGGK